MNAADVLAVDSPDEEIAVTLHLYDEFGERPWTGYERAVSTYDSTASFTS